MGSAPRFDRKLARQLSPLRYVEKAKTPTLFMQGKDDERCPRCPSEELFVSLMNAGDTPAELMLYPRESHSFLGEAGRNAVRTPPAVSWSGSSTTARKSWNRSSRPTRRAKTRAGPAEDPGARRSGLPAYPRTPHHTELLLSVKP